MQCPKYLLFNHANFLHRRIPCWNARADHTLRTGGREYRDCPRPLWLPPEVRRPLSPRGARITRVGDEIHVLSENGTILHIASSSNVVVPVTPRALVDGFVTGAEWFNPTTNPINFLSTAWTVPNLPAEYIGQTLFLGTGIQPASGEMSLQTVLQVGYPSHVFLYHSALASLSVRPLVCRRWRLLG